MIKINDLVKVKNKGYEMDDLDAEAIDIFAGEKAKVVRLINENTVEIEFLDKENQRVAESEKANIALIEDLEIL